MTAASTRRMSPLQFAWKMRDPLALLEELRQWPGDTATIHLGKHTVVLLKHPDLIFKLLMTDAAHTVKGRTLERSQFFRFLGDGLMNSEGEPHRRQRRIVLPAFHRSRLTGYAQTIVDVVHQSVAPWQHGEVRDIAADMMNLTLTVVSRTLFSSDARNTAALVAESFHRLSDHVNRMAFWSALGVFRLPFFSKLNDRPRLELDNVIYALIRDRRADGKDMGDLLSMLLQAEDEEHPGEKLSDTELRDQTITLFFAGHEATANAFTWTLWLLAQHPDVAAALEAEIAAVLKDRDPTFEDVPRLVVCEQVVREAMRLYPPVAAIGRRPTSPLVFGDTQADTASLVLASQWLLHRDARWYPDPDRFQPSRWTPEFRVSLPRFAYFPFGGGPRSCIGENYAWMEFVLVLATLIRRWRFSMTPEAQGIKPHMKITMHPDRPVTLRIEKRA